jgi:predicted RNase H-like HicB family nuclease
MMNIIQFYISKGKKYYVANSVNLPIVTQAKTLDKLTENIKETVELFFENENSKDLENSKIPSVLINYELPNKIYA